MKPDTRDKNKYFNADSIEKYLLEYRFNLFNALGEVKNLTMAYRLVEETAAIEGQVFVAGNGGSAAIANHLECDFSKGCSHNDQTIRSRSLSANPSVITALGNDVGFASVFSNQIKMYGKLGDLIILVSSSGNSPNIVQALAAARGRSIKTIGMTGFDGGVLKGECDVSLHVPFSNYGVVEDCHQILMHILAQFYYVKTAER